MVLLAPGRERRRTYSGLRANGATASPGRETIFDALGVDERVYLADAVSRLVAPET